MLDEELIVEVRNKTLARVGTITPEYRQIKIVPRVNDVGEWQVTLPGDHPMVAHLNTPGSGVIITQITGPSTSRVVMSGPTSDPTLVRNRDNPDGLLTFKGVGDTIIAADALAYGDPTNLYSAQTTANDVRTGKAETIMRAYVNANVGPGAIASRRTQIRQYVTLATDGLRGPTVTKSPRFQNLLELLQEIAIYSSLTFRFVQSGNSIVFEVGAVTDRSALVRLDIQNGTLESEQVQQVPAGATRALVAGQGEGTARLLVERTTADSVAAESNWGRVIERFLDARDKSVTAELQQQGDEYLIANGAVDYAIKAVAADSQTMRYGIDWFEGDLVAVVIDGTEQKVNVVSAAIVDGPDGVLVGAAIGDIAKMQRETTTEQRLDTVESRVSTLERSDGGALGSVAATPGTIMLRDGSGNSQVGTPANAADAVPKSYADGLGTAAATPSTIVRRDAAGRFAAVAAVAASDVVIKSQMDAAVVASMPTGAIVGWAAVAPPSGFLLANGQEVSRTTYAALFAALNPSIGTATITIASPGVVTLTGHGLSTGQMIYLTTTGALPTGLSASTVYFAINVTANTFRLATTLANALAGTAINTSGTQSGTHTIFRTSGLGDGSTTFNVPDLVQSVTQIATGQLSITPSAANTPTSGAVTFPVGLFDVAPRVVITPESTQPGTAITGTAANAISTTGFTAWVTRTNTTATLLSWVATHVKHANTSIIKT